MNKVTKVFELLNSIVVCTLASHCVVQARFDSMSDRMIIMYIGYMTYTVYTLCDPERNQCNFPPGKNVCTCIQRLYILLIKSYPYIGI